MSNHPILSILDTRHTVEWPQQAIDAGIRRSWYESGINEQRVIKELESQGCLEVTWLDLAAYQRRHQSHEK